MVMLEKKITEQKKPKRSDRSAGSGALTEGDLTRCLHLFTFLSLNHTNAMLILIFSPLWDSQTVPPSPTS